MRKSHESYQRGRLRSSYISVVISIALVLFLLGGLGVTLVKTKKISNKIKEKVALTVFLKDKTTKNQVDAFITSLKQKDYVKRLRYISKDKAAREYKDEIGEDFVSFLGLNPLKDAVDIYIKANYVVPERLIEIEENLKKNAYVLDVIYDKSLISLLTENIRAISFWVLVVSGFFTLISVILINSYIRLAVYSKRFIIKTMQMVGATKRFVRRPFINISVLLGVIGALLANLAIGFVLYYIHKNFPGLEIFDDVKQLIAVGLVVFVAGALITWVSTYFAIQRFLNLRTEELYWY